MWYKYSNIIVFNRLKNLPTTGKGVLAEECESIYNEVKNIYLDFSNLADLGDIKISKITSEINMVDPYDFISKVKNKFSGMKYEELQLLHTELFDNS